MLSIILAPCIMLFFIPSISMTDESSAAEGERTSYVSEKGSDEGGDGTQENPFKTLEKATADAQANDIYILEDTISVPLGWENPKVPITIWGYGEENSRFEMENSASANKGGKASIYLQDDVHS